MKLSKSFVSDYVDITNIDYNEIAEKMVFAGNEYESIEPICDATNLVVGEILECSKHPESKKLSICKVDIGEKEPVQILCGAPNVVDAKKVIVAKIGAALSGITIKKAKLAGMESNGMICSLAELGLDSKYVTEEDKKGIHKLPDDAPVGKSATSYLGFDDQTIDFELTANRADLMSVLGMAYEIGAIYNKKVQEPEITVTTIKDNIEDIMKLDVKTKQCSIYLGKLVKNVVIKESPDFIKTRLMASGIRPINNVVDISNYVMLEYGQPLHFFDKDKLGNHVIVRNAKKDEVITTLDGIERILNKDDIVIANEKEAACLAGVMGGLNTEVDYDTKNIFIEAAIFDSLNIRKTAKNILRSESSNRYEKGIDPNRTKKAILRACYLLNKYASGEVCDGMLVHDVAQHDDKKIEITLDKINQVLGLNLTNDIVIDIFERLGFNTKVNKDTLIVTVPTRRLDINIKEDLIEEVGRIYGYNHIEGHMPISNVRKGGFNKSNSYLRGIRKHLSALGLNQVITYSLINEKQNEMFKTNDKESVKLLSPMSEDRSIMRRSLASSLLDVYEYNLARMIKDVAIYETGNIYYKENNEYKEDMMLSGLLSGTYLKNQWNGVNVKVDFYLVKGIIENLLKYLGLSNRYHFEVEENINNMHPGRTASIIVDRTNIGYFGQVHPNACKKEVYIFEINLKTLSSIKVRDIKFKEMSKYPSVKKDVAFIVDKKVTSEEIKNIISKTGGRMLSNVSTFDVYEGENVDKDKKSIAYALEFKDDNRTLNDEEVTKVFNKIIESVTTKLNAVLRDK